MKQQKIWNKISLPWKTFRTKPVKEVIDFLKNKKGKILDLGCGTGRHLIKNPNLKFYGLDFSEEMLKHAKEYAEKNKIKAELIKADATKLPFKNNFFDSAIFIAALHCIPNEKDREKSLMELLRVLKPRAEALISVWDYDQKKFKDSKKENFIPWKKDGKEYLRYYYLYEKKEFLNLLKKVGFKIIKVMSKENPSGLYSKKNIIVVVKKPN